VSLWAILDLGSRLLKAYVLDAWPFFLLHVVVVIYLGRSYRRMRRETDELKYWQPGLFIETGPAAVLSSFVRDSSSLGSRGFVVPITDYSDRLDAEVENLVDELGERTNMLLLVGIAGTLFGMFEFAARSITVTGDRLAQIGGILAESIAKAFPVGFVGLVSMLVIQLLLARPISQYHSAASEATRRALEHRGVVSRTLAESIADSIGKSMQPVSSLGQTISLHLEPVITSLGERLEQSLELIKRQFSEIDQSTARFMKSTSNLQQSTNALTNTAASLGDLLKTTPQVLAKTQKIQELQESALTQIATSLQQNLELAAALTEGLQRVQASTEDLPEQLIKRTVEAIGPAFERLATDSVSMWGDLVRSISGDLQTEYAEFVTGTRHEIVRVHEEIRSAADEWQRLAANSQALIAEPLQKGLDQITSSSQHVLDLAGSLSESIDIVQTQLLAMPDRFIAQTAAAVEPAFERVARQSVETWHELVRSVAVGIQRDYAEYVSTSAAEVAHANAQMRSVSEEMNRLAQNASAFLTEPMRTAIETARQEVSGALSQLDDFVRNRYPAVKLDVDTFGTQMAAMTQALAGVEQRLSDLRFDVRIDSVSDTSPILIEIRELLKPSVRPVPVVHPVAPPPPPPPPNPPRDSLWSRLWPSRRSSPK
jgi:hypothetical protein